MFQATSNKWFSKCLLSKLIDGRMESSMRTAFSQFCLYIPPTHTYTLAPWESTCWSSLNCTPTCTGIFVGPHRSCTQGFLSEVEGLIGRTRYTTWECTLQFGESHLTTGFQGKHWLSQNIIVLISKGLTLLRTDRLILKKQLSSSKRVCCSTLSWGQDFLSLPIFPLDPDWAHRRLLLSVLRSLPVLVGGRWQWLREGAHLVDWLGPS